MSFLPEVGADGRLIPEKKQYVMPRTSKKVKTFLSWENLLMNRCPSCGETIPNHIKQQIKLMKVKEKYAIT